MIGTFSTTLVDTEAEKRQKELEKAEKLQLEQADLTLDFWLKGHVTGANRPENENDLSGGKDDLSMCIRKLGKRTERFEINMQRSKAMIESGFERIELHLEAQYKVFQDIIRKSDRKELRSKSKK